MTEAERYAEKYSVLRASIEDAINLGTLLHWEETYLTDMLALIDKGRILTYEQIEIAKKIIRERL